MPASLQRATFLPDDSNWKNIILLYFHGARIVTHLGKPPTLYAPGKLAALVRRYAHLLFLIGTLVAIPLQT
ncbi:MAG: hypothetical protein WCI05_06150 [Myxococcales bacterium]